MSNTRTEHDFLGEMQIPDEAYYGVQTLRALQNFKITGIRMASEPLFIQAFAFVKKAAALANRDCGVLDIKLAEAIGHACDEIISGKYHDQFVTDMIQGGAGTSTNMNVNEVIANIGLEYLGYSKGEYEHLHPNNHVNCSQSTNDAYPTAFRAALYKKTELYITSLEALRSAFAQKGEAFAGVLKMGRTQLQDAVPMTLGQEFHGFATAVASDIARLKEGMKLLLSINIGGTAIGTAVNAPKNYAELCRKYLSDISGLPLKPAADLIDASSDTADYLELSGLLKRNALKISKICNDLRLLSSGPRAGLNEISLPQMQPGSSIMPGKVNPVIPEVVSQAAFYVAGADMTISMASEAGQLQLNVMEPVIVFSLFTSFEYMTNAVKALTEKCVTGIAAHAEVCKGFVMNSVGIVTFLNPILGYETSADIAKEALNAGRSVHDIAVLERKLISQEKWDEIFTPENMVHPVFING